MRQIVFLILTPVIAMSVLAFGNGFLTTYATLELNDANTSSVIIGVISAACGLGSVCGPILVSVFNHVFSDIGLFIFTTTVSICLSVYIIYRLGIRTKAKDDNTVQFMLVSPKSTAFSEAQKVVSENLDVQD